MVDLILHHGQIYTLDARKPRVQALAISRGVIVAAGDNDEILELATRNTIRQNLEDNTVIPGLTDAHIHWLWTARTLREVDVFEAPSREVIAQRVAQRAAQQPEGTWIVGQGWSQESWEDRRFPTAADLDDAAPNHPVYLRAKSAHAFWVNSLALKMAGIDENTADPVGGQIGRDENGKPNGMLYELAGPLVARLIPPPTMNDVAEMMHEAQKLALASGLTGIHDFDGPECLVGLQTLRERGQLALRVVKNIQHHYIDHAHELGIRWGFGDDWIRFGHLKMFADGALGPRTAWMFEPYEGEPENRGVIVMPPEELQRYASKASAMGIPTTIHAIGDRAVHEVLNVLEAVRKEEAARGETPHQRRHRIEHVQLIHPQDVPRMKSLEIIASMQPIHATSDYKMADRYWGEERNPWAYNPRIQLDQGVVVAFGSDSPIDPFEPLRGIHAAVTRQRPDGSPEGGWYPSARLTIDEAVRGFTVGPAYAAGQENRLGKLSEGHLADLVVLDNDIFKAEPEAIPDLTVLGTMVDGVWRFGGV